MSTSSSFPWKRIEEQPDNADDVRQLIDDVIQEKINSKELKQPLNILKLFIENFKMEKFFKIENNTQKKKTNSKKDILIEKNEQKTISEDFKQFSFQEDFSLKTLHLRFPINNFLYILYWCLSILRGLKEKKKISSLVILDATLSINRILLKDIITDPNYKSGFLFFNKKMNDLINENNEKFYNILFENPKLLHYSSFQTINKEISLYKEQRQILSKIKKMIELDQPLLLGNQMPTGQGKTFLAVLLAKMFSSEKNQEKKKCVLFGCSNELVNLDVASNTLCGNEIHLWLAKNVIIDIFDKKGNFLRKDKRVLLRPYKRCFPSTWKKIYKKKEDDKYKNGEIHEQWNYYVKATGRIPDIIVADLDASSVLLKNKDKLLNILGYFFSFSLIFSSKTIFWSSF